jgi:hypothetical protein
LRRPVATLAGAALLALTPAAHARPLIVGDSVTVAAAAKLRATGWDVEARKNRTMLQGLALLRSRRLLPATVAIALGTNAGVFKHDVAAALRIVGRRRRLVLVTPREVRGEGTHDADVMRVLARRHPLRIVLVDWARSSRGHGAWVTGDLIHLTPSGASAYTAMLAAIARDARAIGEIPARRAGGLDRQQRLLTASAA